MSITTISSFQELVCSNLTVTKERAACIAKNQDNVRILVRLVELETKTYSEKPVLNVNEFSVQLASRL